MTCRCFGRITLLRWEIDIEYFIRDLPVRFQTRELLLLSLSNWGHSLRQLDAADRTRELYETAIKSRLYNENDIPMHNWDRSLI